MAIKRCPICGFHGKVSKNAPGSFGLELVLWIVIFPVGIIYSLWRLFGKHECCPACGNPNLIDANRYTVPRCRVETHNQRGFATLEWIKALLVASIACVFVYAFAYIMLLVG